MSADDTAVDARKCAAFVTRHRPTEHMRRSLGNRRIVMVDPGRDHFRSGGDAWRRTVAACGGAPDILVAALPDHMMIQLVKRARRAGCTVLQASMSQDRRSGKWRWTGIWLEVRYVKVVTTTWSPADHWEGVRVS
jgi:hypothetical protein